MSKQSQPGLSDVLPDSNATPAVTHTTTTPAAPGETPAAPAPTQPPAQAQANTGKPGKVAKAKGKPEITGEPEAAAEATPAATEAAPEAPAAPVPEPARGRTGRVLEGLPPLLPGMKVAYWMPAKKNDKPRTIFGFETDLVYRHAVIVEVHPAGVIHLLLGEPGGWIPLNCDEVAFPQVGRFTRLTREDLESLGF